MSEELYERRYYLGEISEYHDLMALREKISAISKNQENPLATTNPFIYRGQANYDWHLTTTLERWVSDFKESKKTVRMGEGPYGRDPREWSEVQLKTVYIHLLERKIKEGHFDSVYPNLVQYQIMKYILLQHYGNPTPLLDFTTSLDVALFFAINPFQNQDAALWMVNTNALKSISSKSQADLARFPDINYPDIGKEIEDLIQNPLKENVPLKEQLLYLDWTASLTQHPDINNRINAQKSVFLYAPICLRSFEECLFGVGGDNSLPGPQRIALEEIRLSSPDVLEIYKIKIPIAPIKFLLFQELLEEDEEVSYRTLFPDLEGFSRSLHNELVTFFEFLYHTDLYHGLSMMEKIFKDDEKK